MVHTTRLLEKVAMDRGEQSCQPQDPQVSSPAKNPTSLCLHLGPLCLVAPAPCPVSRVRPSPVEEQTVQPVSRA